MGKVILKHHTYAMAALLLACGGLAACGDVGRNITRLAVGDPGPDAYTLVANTDQKNMPTGNQPGGQGQPNGQGNAGGQSPAGGVHTGDQPGLYGGTRHATNCDARKLASFLQSQPAKAAAWANVHHISPADIPGFVSNLTPVILRTDTLVTNHGYRDGHATSLTALLQAGIGVLVNNEGTPIVKCNCGNPLTPPDRDVKPDDGKYSGASWPTFSPERVVIVVPKKVESFTLVEPSGTVAFVRPPGTNGRNDGPPTIAPPSPAASSPVPGGSPGQPGQSNPSSAPAPGSPGSSAPADSTGPSAPTPGGTGPSTPPSSGTGPSAPASGSTGPSAPVDSGGASVPPGGNGPQPGNGATTQPGSGATQPGDGGGATQPGGGAPQPGDGGGATQPGGGSGGGGGGTQPGGG
jgi:hypothetical protein